MDAIFAQLSAVETASFRDGGVSFTVFQADEPRPRLQLGSVRRIDKMRFVSILKTLTDQKRLSNARLRRIDQ